MSTATTLPRTSSPTPLGTEPYLNTTSPSSSTTTPTARQTLLSVAIPCYNEKDTIREILARLDALQMPGVNLEILLVDDGSKDGTREILTHEITPQYPNVRVFFHEKNQGKGAAIVTAIAQASGDYLIVQDADLEYDPADYAKLLAVLQEDPEAKVVYGSRFIGHCEGMALPNRIANITLTLLANLLFPGARITDEATCYKMFRMELLKTIPLKSQRFDFCPEVTSKVLRRGIKIGYHASTVEQGKKIRWQDGFEAIAALVKYRFRD
jgi:dolichol-phosphate mannosyltransferase